MALTESSSGLRVDDFDYDLPEELIAQLPLEQRDASRLMVVDRASGSIQHSTIARLSDWLDPGDLLVANNSRVIPARVMARKHGTGGRVELLLLRRQNDGSWQSLAKPSRRLRIGTRLVVMPAVGSALRQIEVHVRDVAGDGRVVLALAGDERDCLEEYGSVPLPPYIRTRLDDSERYQTIYATTVGSAAAPTAGLHFTPELLARLGEHGVRWAEVTLHVGLDTFRPVSVERVDDHHMHGEWWSVPDETAQAVADTRMAGGRIVAIGTTTARTLEAFGGGWNAAAPKGSAGTTDLFVRPGHTWGLVDAMLTNFHLPRSTLLMMVSSLAGTSLARLAYGTAVNQRYRFFSFGDAMLIR